MANLHACVRDCGAEYLRIIRVRAVEVASLNGNSLFYEIGRLGTNTPCGARQNSFGVVLAIVEKGQENLAVRKGQRRHELMTRNVRRRRIGNVWFRPGL